MKALTVRQPWAAAIATLGKDVENRSWSTTYRGPLAIHAASRWAPEDASVEVAKLSGVLIVHSPVSVVIAVVDLVDVCRPGAECACGRWAIDGQFHWRLSNARPLPYSVACKGRLGLWDLPASVESSVLAQIGVAS